MTVFERRFAESEALRARDPKLYAALVALDEIDAAQAIADTHWKRFEEDGDPLELSRALRADDTVITLQQNAKDDQA